MRVCQHWHNGVSMLMSARLEPYLDTTTRDACAGDSFRWCGRCVYCLRMRIGAEMISSLKAVIADSDSARLGLGCIYPEPSLVTTRSQKSPSPAPLALGPNRTRATWQPFQVVGLHVGGIRVGGLRVLNCRRDRTDSGCCCHHNFKLKRH
jgi:hypothetical protein